jgi:hypothetical protein
VLADALTRDTSIAAGLAPGAGLGTLLLVVALVRSEQALGWALFVGGATYLGAVVAAGSHIDATAPAVALLLLLCGELTAWSLAERVRIRSDEPFRWRRGAALAVLALVGIGAATLVIALSAVRPGHGLVWTALGTAAAVGAAGTGALLARR